MRPLTPSFRRRCLPHLLALAIGGTHTAGAPAQSAAPVVELDRIAAIVNDDVITGSELEARLSRVREQLRRAGTRLPPPEVLRRQVLERLIVDRIQLQLARGSGIRIDDETLNRALLRLAERSRLTLREFRDALERDGHDFAKFREELRDEIAISEVRKLRVESRVQVSERDVDDHLSTIESQRADSEYHIGHILIAIPDGASPETITEARERTERVLGEIRAGADFANMAAANSDGQRALEGGDLGWRKAPDLPTMLGDAVLRLAVGEVTEPIRSASGFHLVKLIGKRSGEQPVVVEQTRARHVLIVLDELTDEAAARRELSALRERVVNGEDFGELARAHSDDAGSAPKGGELGWINPGDTVPEFENAMGSLEPGGLSEPFKSQYGWHIVQVLERREHDDTEAARRAEALRSLRARKLEEDMQSWVRQVRDEAYVEYRLGE